MGEVHSGFAAGVPAPLTPGQRKVLTFIERMWKAKGYAPTNDEIAEHLGGVSTSTAHGLVMQLAKKGHVAKLRNAPRGIALRDCSVVDQLRELREASLPIAESLRLNRLPMPEDLKRFRSALGVA